MKRLLPFASLLLLLASCVPGASLVSQPSFSLVASDSGLVRLEPPGVGRGAAVFRITVDAHNPNPFAVRLAAIDGDFALNDRRVASSRFADGVDLPASGTSRMVLEVEAPLVEAPHLVSSLARLLSGEPVSYRLEGTVAMDVMGSVQRFPAVTLARGELARPALSAPEVRLDVGASGVSVQGLRAVVDVGLVIDNPMPLGFLARGPELVVRLDGRPIGRASIPQTPVPAMSETTAVLRVEAGMAELGAALLTRLQGGGSGLQAGLVGELSFEIPGVVSTSRPLEGPLGVLR